MTEIELIGGPCDGQKIQHTGGQYIYIPLHNGAWASMGETIDQTAIYTLTLTELTATHLRTDTK